MKIFGYEINKGSEISEIKESFDLIKKKLKDADFLRPDAESLRKSSADSDGARIPLYPVSERHLYTLGKSSDIVMTIIGALRDGIFRRGTEIIEKEDIEESPEDAEAQQLILEKVQKIANLNRQNLMEVLKEMEEDIDLLDNGYLIAIKEYTFDGNGNILPELTEVKEFIRGSPIRMRVISDNQGRISYNNDGKRVYVSVSNRSKTFLYAEAKKLGFKDPKTGKAILPAYYRGEVDYGEHKYIYYIDGEVLHVSKCPNLIYGTPKMMAVWLKVATLIEQDRYLFLAYQKGRPPRGMLTINAVNYQSIRKSWETLKSETRKDPHSIAPMLISEKDKVQFIDFLRPPAEMEFTVGRNEMRRQIGANWGVLPIFAADVSQSGGLNNDSQQITVTNRAIQEGQKLYNQKVFPWISKSLGVKDMVIQLLEPEERDETEDARRMGIKIDNATKMVNMGFDVSFDKEEEEFKFSDVPVNEPSGQFFPGPTSMGGVQQIGGAPTKASNFINLEDERDKINMINKINTIYTIYSKEMIKEGISIDIKKAEIDDLVKFISAGLFARKFEGLSKAISSRIKNVILDAVVDKSTITDTVKKIEKLGVDKEQAELIVRTEQSVLKNRVREFNFEKVEGSDKFRYKWIGPADNRTSDISKEIKKKSIKGMKLETLKTLVRKTSEKFGFKPDRDWFSHPNQRHTFTRVV